VAAARRRSAARTSGRWRSSSVVSPIGRALAKAGASRGASRVSSSPGRWPTSTARRWRDWPSTASSSGTSASTARTRARLLCTSSWLPAPRSKRDSVRRCVSPSVCRMRRATSSRFCVPRNSK